MVVARTSYCKTAVSFSSGIPASESHAAIPKRTHESIPRRSSTVSFAAIAALGETEQPHLHAMFSDRISDGIDRTPDQHFRRQNPTNPELGGCKKHSGGKSPAALREEVTATRQTCAQLQNAILEKYGHDARVDSRSHQARGIAREPERHLGQARIKKMSPEERALFNTMQQGAPCASA